MSAAGLSKARLGRMAAVMRGHVVTSTWRRWERNDLDRMVGGEFEKGLENLKSVTEVAANN